MNVTHGVLFVAHLIAALATTVVLVVMRNQAKVALATPSTAARGDRRNMAARLFHLVPVTGAAVIGTSQGDISWSEPWVLLGVALYLAGAVVLEANVLPAERRGQSRSVVRGVEWSLVLLVLAALSMLIQF